MLKILQNLICALFDVPAEKNFSLTNSRSETMDSIANSLDDMVKDCEVIEFPQVRHDFSDTKIYWRIFKQPLRP